MQNNGGRFFDGLLFGAIIGGASVFLLGTKKGNKIIKVISEGGLDSLTEMFEDFEQGVEQGIKTTTKDIEKKEERDIEKIEEKLAHEASPNGINHETGHRRFFKKGSPKA